MDRSARWWGAGACDDSSPPRRRCAPARCRPRSPRGPSSRRARSCPRTPRSRRRSRGSSTPTRSTRPTATQPVGGFSAILDAGNGDYYAMPDNGFGSQGQLALVRPAPVQGPPELQDRVLGQRQGHHQVGDHAVGPRRQGAVPDRQREHGGSHPDRRRLRHRVGPPARRRHVLLRRRVRPVPGPHGRQGRRARRAGAAAARDVAGQPVSCSAARRTSRPRTASRGWR